MNNEIYKVLNDYYDKRREELIILLSKELTLPQKVSLEARKAELGKTILELTEIFDKIT